MCNVFGVQIMILTLGYFVGSRTQGFDPRGNSPRSARLWIPRRRLRSQEDVRNRAHDQYVILKRFYSIPTNRRSNSHHRYYRTGCRRTWTCRLDYRCPHHVALHHGTRYRRRLPSVCHHHLRVCRHPHPWTHGTSMRRPRRFGADFQPSNR